MSNIKRTFLYAIAFPIFTCRGCRGKSIGEELQRWPRGSPGSPRQGYPPASSVASSQAHPKRGGHDRQSQGGGESGQNKGEKDGKLKIGERWVKRSVSLHWPGLSVPILPVSLLFIVVVVFGRTDRWRTGDEGAGVCCPRLAFLLSSHFSHTFLPFVALSIMIHHQPIYVYICVPLLTSGARAAASAMLLAVRSRSTRLCKSASANASNPELRLLSAK